MGLLAFQEADLRSNSIISTVYTSSIWSVVIVNSFCKAKQILVYSVLWSHKNNVNMFHSCVMNHLPAQTNEDPDYKHSPVRYVLIHNRSYPPFSNYISHERQDMKRAIIEIQRETNDTFWISAEVELNDNSYIPMITPTAGGYERLNSPTL